LSVAGCCLFQFAKNHSTMYIPNRRLFRLVKISWHHHLSRITTYFDIPTGHYKYFISPCISVRYCIMASLKFLKIAEYRGKLFQLTKRSISPSIKVLAGKSNYYISQLVEYRFDICPSGSVPIPPMLATYDSVTTMLAIHRWLTNAHAGYMSIPPLLARR